MSDGPDAAAAAQAAMMAGLLNQTLSGYLTYSLLAACGVFMGWRAYVGLKKYIRILACINDDSQRYFMSPSLAPFKRNVAYAPLFRKRHNREFQLSSAINAGTVPTRVQFVFLLAYFAANIVLGVINIDFSGNFAQVAGLVRNRAGTLALANLTPLFFMAGRNSPFIVLTNISFDTFNLLHRWFGRIVVLEVLVHVLSFMALVAHEAGGWNAAIQAVFATPRLMYGFIGACAFVAISIQAASAFRHAFYETFKMLHIALAMTVLVTVYLHLKTMPQVQGVIAVMATWGVDRGARMLRLMLRNVGAGGTRTVVEALPGNACRVTVTMARPWDFKPGQHAYLYMPAIGLWQSHPFSVAWSQDAEDTLSELPVSRSDTLKARKTSMSFVIRGRSGFTDKLCKKAAASPDGQLVTSCFVEGPYGQQHTMHSYGTVVLFAGGVGITHAVPYVRDLISGYINGTVATRKITLVWMIKNPEHLDWIRSWMTEILAMDKRRDILRILIFISQPWSAKQFERQSETVQLFPGRPNIEKILAMEMEQRVGAMGVSVCGPGALSDDVRQAVRNHQQDGTVDFFEESFSW